LELSRNVLSCKQDAPRKSTLSFCPSQCSSLACVDLPPIPGGEGLKFPNVSNTCIYSSDAIPFHAHSVKADCNNFYSEQIDMPE
jgi:hypothetical protein